MKDDWYLEMGGNYVIQNDKVFGRNIYVSLDDIDSVRERFKNRDVFATIFIYNHEDQDQSDLYGPLYVDLDLTINTEIDYEKIKKDLSLVVTSLTTFYHVPLEFIKIYFSGHKGFHVIVPPEVFGIEPNRELNGIFRFIATDLKNISLFKTVDTGIYDNKRLLRLPNSVHSETELYKVPVSYEFIRASTWSDIQQYASEPHDMDYSEPRPMADACLKFEEMYKGFKKEQESLSNRSLGIRKGGPLLPCIQYILDNGVSKGQRNNTTVALASALFQNGIEFEEVVKKIESWNSEKNSPRLSDKEIMTTVKSAYSYILSGKGYGCRAIKGLELCEKTNCRINKKKVGGSRGGTKKRRTIIH
jgi:hypothetical protein